VIHPSLTNHPPKENQTLVSAPGFKFPFWQNKNKIPYVMNDSKIIGYINEMFKNSSSPTAPGLLPPISNKYAETAELKPPSRVWGACIQSPPEVCHHREKSLVEAPKRDWRNVTARTPKHPAKTIVSHN
jgi:hypothetical protein